MELLIIKECFICCLCHRHPSSKVLLCTAITPFTCRNTVSTLVCSFIILIKVLAGAALLRGRAVEIIEHQVHICPLLALQMIYYGLISVHLNLYIALGLSRECPGLMKVGCCGLLRVIITLLCFLVVTHIKGLPPHHFRFVRSYGFLLYTSIWVKSLGRSSAVIDICRGTIFVIRLSRVIEMGRGHCLLALLFGLDGAPITVLVRLLGGLAFNTAVVFIW